MTAHTASDVARYGTAMLDELEKAIVGKRDVLKLLLTGISRAAMCYSKTYPDWQRLSLLVRSLRSLTWTSLVCSSPLTSYQVTSLARRCSKPEVHQAHLSLAPCSRTWSSVTRSTGLPQRLNLLYLKQWKNDR